MRSMRFDCYYPHLYNYSNQISQKAKDVKNAKKAKKKPKRAKTNQKKQKPKNQKCQWCQAEIAKIAKIAIIAETELVRFLETFEDLVFFVKKIWVFLKKLEFPSLSLKVANLL